MTIAGRYEEAIKFGERSIQIQPDFPVGLLAISYACSWIGLYDRSIAALERLVSVPSPNPWWFSLLGLVYARAGRKEDALRVRAELIDRRQHEYVGSYAEL